MTEACLKSSAGRHRSPTPTKPDAQLLELQGPADALTTWQCTCGAVYICSGVIRDAVTSERTKVPKKQIDGRLQTMHHTSEARNYTKICLGHSELHCNVKQQDIWQPRKPPASRSQCMCWSRSDGWRSESRGSASQPPSRPAAAGRRSSGPLNRHTAVHTEHCVRE